MKPFDLATYVAQSTRKSGVPLRITNALVLALIARLIRL
jgi:hypothetical protein